tara:strand:- start:2118 stop:2345 length:228 start_codon:yes stop_codon:yes gene_type:complete
MPVTIFHRESGAEEKWLTLNDDESVTYDVDRTGWPLMRKGSDPKVEKMTVDEAKARWPSYADRIDAALAEVRQNS